MTIHERVSRIDSNSQCVHCVLLILYLSGCGVRIRTGTSCADTTTIGGLYYEDTVLSDPWTNERYSASEVTTRAGFYDGDFQGLIEIGTTAIEGRVFVCKYRYYTSVCVHPSVYALTRIDPYTHPTGYSKNMLLRFFFSCSTRTGW